jgi:hypothetical protein
MVISGGTATLLGPVAGAAIVVIMKYVVSAYVVRWNLVLGVIFVAIISFMPEGLVPGSVRIWSFALRRWLARGSPNRPDRRRFFSLPGGPGRVAEGPGPTRSVADLAPPPRAEEGKASRKPAPRASL